MPIALLRRLAITADVLDDAPESTTLRDVELALRAALEREGFEVGRIDVRIEPGR